AAADVLVLVTGEEAAGLEFASAARLRVQVAPTPDDIVEAFRAMQLPEGDGFIWCAGEALMARQVRDILFVDKDFPREAARISAYWKKGASAHHENLE
ncbi:MAG TPA: SIP domain-containing protein, partial [Duganella sp.]|nr:SIP domain-containing protein [Duganella sp.]